MKNSNVLTSLTEIFDRDLGKVIEEIKSYKEEPDVWRVFGDINNSAGNICLHIIGNLKHYVGAVIGKTGYIREREKEFSEHNIPRQKLLIELDFTRLLVRKILTSISPEDLSDEFSDKTFGNGSTIGHALLQLAVHLNYHLGQINYHRRLSSI